MDLVIYKKQGTEDNWNEIMKNKTSSIIYLYYILKQKIGQDRRSSPPSDMTSFILSKVSSIFYQKQNIFDNYMKEREEELADIFEINFPNFKNLELDDKLNLLENLICIHFNSNIQKQVSLNIAKYGFYFIKSYIKGIKNYNNNKNLFEEELTLTNEDIENILRKHFKEIKIDANSINRSIRRLYLYYNHYNEFSEEFILTLSESYVENLTTKHIRNNLSLQKELLRKIENKEIKKLSGLKKEISNYLEKEFPVFNFERFENLKKIIDKSKDSLESYKSIDLKITLSSLKAKEVNLKNLDGNIEIQKAIFKANNLLIELDELINEIIKTSKVKKTSNSDKRKLEKIVEE